MKKAFIPLFSILVVSVFFCNIASAQTNTTNPLNGVTNISSSGITDFSTSGTTNLVATVNIYNAKIVTQADRDFTISFDISNRIGAQPQVKYAMQLMKSSSTTGNTLIDEKIYDEVLSLGENAAESRTIEYSVPMPIPAGTYNLSILSENESGLILGNSSLGQVTIKASTSNTVEIVPDSCKFVLQGATSTQYVSFGSFFQTNDDNKFAAKCDIVSSFENDIILIPKFVTKNNTAFGSVASATGGSKDNITIKKGTSSIDFELPKASKPQEYNVSISLVSADGSIASNQVSSDYLLGDETGLIKNVIFDKTSYNKGDKANLQILTYVNIALTTKAPALTTASSTMLTTIASTGVVVSISNNLGELCGNASSNVLEDFLTIQVPIIKNCINPRANIVLSKKDNSGAETVLDTRGYQITTPTMPIAPQNPFVIDTKIIILIAIAIILIILFILLVYKKKHPIAKAIILVFFASSAMFGFSRDFSVAAMALPYPGGTLHYNYSTNCYYYWGHRQCGYGRWLGDINFSFDKHVYYPDSPITVTTSTSGVENVYGYDGKFYYNYSVPGWDAEMLLSGSIDGKRPWQTIGANYAWTYSGSGSFSFSPAAAGSHNLHIELNFYTGHGGYYMKTADIPFTVSDFPTCDWSYGAWTPATCPESGQQTRTESYSPGNCTGGTRSATTQSCTPPLPPNPLSPAISSIDHGFKISWSTPSPAPASYKIYKSTSSGAIIQTIQTSGLSFNDNRIQNPSSVTSTNPLYYKITSIKANGQESTGTTVNTIGLGPVQYVVSPITVKGSGFVSGSTITIVLISVDTGERYNCGQFTYQDSNTITGSCNITDTPTGTFDVEVTMISGGKTTKAVLPSGFQISYPAPISPSISISTGNLDLTSGKLIIDSIQGDNLYTGAQVNLVVKDGSGKVLVKQTCFNLGEFNYSTQKFPGGNCSVSSGITNATGGDYGKIKIEIANDENSTPSSITTPTFTCNSNSWSPDPSTVCLGISFTQTNNCGAPKSQLSIGTLPISWSPSTSAYCPGTAFTQTSTNCSPVQTRNGIVGTMSCSAGQVCQNNTCVNTCTPITQGVACSGKNCGSVSDGCGGTINCGSCVSPNTCGGGGAANVCGCTPTETANNCSNSRVCGSIDNGCGTQVNCGSCPQGWTDPKYCHKDNKCYYDQKE